MRPDVRGILMRRRPARSHEGSGQHLPRRLRRFPRAARGRPLDLLARSSLQARVGSPIRHSGQSSMASTCGRDFSSCRPLWPGQPDEAEGGHGALSQTLKGPSRGERLWAPCPSAPSLPTSKAPDHTRRARGMRGSNTRLTVKSTPSTRPGRRSGSAGRRGRRWTSATLWIVWHIPGALRALRA